MIQKNSETSGGCKKTVGNFKYISKSDWGVEREDWEGESLDLADLEDWIKVGCLQRIADSLESINSGLTSLECISDSLFSIDKNLASMVAGVKRLSRKKKANPRVKPS